MLRELLLGLGLRATKTALEASIRAAGTAAHAATAARPYCCCSAAQQARRAAVAAAASHQPSRAALAGDLLRSAVWRQPAVGPGGGRCWSRWQQPPPACQQHGPPSAARGFATVTQRKAAGNPGLKFWKPTSPGQRFRVTVRRTGLWPGRPMRALTRGEKHHGGRNATGRITCRHRGSAAHRKVLRQVDFQRRTRAPGVVQRLEYDPGRSAFIALVKHPPGSIRGQQHGYSYILAPGALQAGDVVQSGEGSPVQPGNVLPLKDIPVGMPIHSIELAPGHGGVLCRAAGCTASIVNKQEHHAIVRLPSGEQRLLSLRCMAAVGGVSNPQHKNRVIGKAGHNRHRGVRPTVRGVAMNPVDHPHGGSTSGGRPSCSPWGLPAKSGFKTRERHKPSNRFILVRRPRRFA